MHKGIGFVLMILFGLFWANQIKAQVKKDTILKPVDTTKVKVLKPTDTAKVKLVKPADTAKTKVMSKRDSAKAKYVNPGKIAARKAVFKSMLIPGWGQLYNIQILNDGYGERAGKSQVFQKIYTGAKIAAIYGGITALTIAYIDNRNNYKIFLAEAQYREQNPGKQLNLTRYTDQGVLDNKAIFKRNTQIVIFSYGLIYLANIVDAYVAARLHFFNIDDTLTFKIWPTAINSNTMYGMNFSPGLKLSLTF